MLVQVVPPFTVLKTPFPAEHKKPTFWLIKLHAKKVVVLFVVWGVQLVPPLVLYSIVDPAAQLVIILNDPMTDGHTFWLTPITGAVGCEQQAVKEATTAGELLLKQSVVLPWRILLWKACENSNLSCINPGIKEFSCFPSKGSSTRAFQYWERHLPSLNIWRHSPSCVIIRKLHIFFERTSACISFSATTLPVATPLF